MLSIGQNYNYKWRCGAFFCLLHIEEIVFVFW